jgi:hypothetical protein
MAWAKPKFAQVCRTNSKRNTKDQMVKGAFLLWIDELCATQMWHA